MKKNVRFLLFALMVIPLQLLLLTSCGPKDSAIQASIDAIRQNNPGLAGITADVQKGVVTLTGEFKDEASRNLAETSIKGVKGVKQVIDNGTVAPPPPPVAPVVIALDDPLTKSVTDATKDFPTVKASVKDGVVTLTGEIKRSNLQKLMMSLHTLNPKKIDNQLTIK